MQTHISDAVRDRVARKKPVGVAGLHALGMFLSVTDMTGIRTLTFGAAC